MLRIYPSRIYRIRTPPLKRGFLFYPQNLLVPEYTQILKKNFQKNFEKFGLLFYLYNMKEEMDEFFQESEVQRLEGEVYDLKSTLQEHVDRERIYQEILSDINTSIMDILKREEENKRFNFDEVIDHRRFMVNMKEYLDNIKREYRGKINF